MPRKGKDGKGIESADLVFGKPTGRVADVLCIVVESIKSPSGDDLTLGVVGVQGFPNVDSSDPYASYLVSATLLKGKSEDFETKKQGPNH